MMPAEWLRLHHKPNRERHERQAAGMNVESKAREKQRRERQAEKRRKKELRRQAKRTSALRVEPI